MIWLVLFVIAFWFSISLTEGWKWRQDKGKSDDNKLINYASYHVWRAVTNGSFIFMFLSTLYLRVAVPLNSVLVVFFLANIVGWVLYERAMSYVISDSWMHKKEKFHIMGISLKRPPVWSEMGIGLVSAALLFMFLI